MSYCRFGWDGSDVYVFTSSTGLECCACALSDEPFGGGEVFKSNRRMIKHLEKHVAAGQHVPDDVFERLRDPADAAENKRIWSEYAKD